MVIEIEELEEVYAALEKHLNEVMVLMEGLERRREQLRAQEKAL